MERNIGNRPTGLESQSGEATVLPGGRSSLSTLLGVFFQPKAAFDSLRQHPRWVVPLVASVVVSFLSMFTILNKLGVGNFMRLASKGSPQADRIAELAEESAAMKVWLYATPILGTPIIILAISGLFLLILTLASGESGFKKTLSVVAHSFFSYYFVNTILTLTTLMLIRDYNDFDLKNPVASNLGFFLDPAETGKFLLSLASSLDVLSFWCIFLLSTGFASVCSNLSMRKSLAIVVPVWLVYVIGKAFFSGLFGFASAS